MWTIFLFCAVVAGTVFVVQFVLAVVGFGADDLEFMDDLPDDLDADLQGDVHGHGSTWLFGVISFRTVVAALTFFGLAGLAAMESGLAEMVSLLVALAAGATAMYGVHYLMQLMIKLRHDGTVRIERSIGKRGTVYVPIPAGKAGAGKVQMRLQDRIVEYQAMTAESEKLATGTRVEVVDVISGNTLEVRPVAEAIETVEA